MSRAIIRADQLDIGTGPNQIVQLDKHGRLPAVDASQLLNLPTSTQPTNVIAPTESGTQQALKQALRSYDNTLLSQAKDDVKEVIDTAAEKARLRHITPGSGQALAYLEKAEEAVDFVVAGYPSDLSDYPWIRAEVEATGKSASQAVDDILAARATWISVGAQIEKIRIGSKVNINKAISIDQLDTIASKAILALEAI